MLHVRGLSKSFPVPKKKKSARRSAAAGSDSIAEDDPRREARRFHAVREVSFRAETGAILGLLGRNGAGKTTLLRMLSTALEPSAGTADFDGIDVVKEPLAVRQKIGFLSGTTGLYGRLTARETIDYFGRLHGVSRDQISQRSAELFDLLEI
ncbi:MAG: ATP-binding cassette domain-containing protein, partial [Myxococcota bacterium]